jgi:peptidoglycan/LPS O-acetylase OafA/YrhL
MGVHIGFPGDELGVLGVDLFFVLSGFLITTLLIKEHQSTGRINLPQFWARRFLRLMPAYWLYLSAIMIIFACTYDRSQTTGSWPVSLYIASLWGYFANYAPQVKIWNHQFLTLHLWSLSVEEQFYFIWPFLMAFALLFRRASWILPWLLALGIMLYRRTLHDNAPGMESWLDTRGIGIVLGTAAAYVFAGAPPIILSFLAIRQVRTIWAILTVTALTALVALHSKGLMSNESVMGVWLPWIDLLFVGIVAGLWYFPGGIISRLLSWKPLAYTGAISYGLYLYHMLASRIIWDVLLPKSANDLPVALQVHDPLHSWPPALAYLTRVTCFLALTFTMAALSFHLLEKPFLTLKDRFRPKAAKSLNG